MSISAFIKINILAIEKKEKHLHAAPNKIIESCKTPAMSKKNNITYTGLEKKTNKLKRAIMEYVNATVHDDDTYKIID